jgi:hypothetical protein
MTEVAPLPVKIDNEFYNMEVSLFVRTIINKLISEKCSSYIATFNGCKIEFAKTFFYKDQEIEKNIISFLENLIVLGKNIPQKISIKVLDMKPVFEVFY